MNDEINTDPNGGALPGAPVTRWTIIIQAARVEGAEAEAALEVLAAQYWLPLYVFVRSRGHGAEDAEDMVQSFFAGKVLRGTLLARADREAGSFRWLLRMAMSSWLVDGHRRGTAQKRGGGVEMVALATEGEEWFQSLPAAGLSPDAMFDQMWALRLSLLAMERLEGEAKDDGITAVLDFMRAGSPPEEQGALALGLRISGEALRQRLHRVRSEKLPAVLRALLWEQSAGPGDFAEGWDCLCEHIPGLRAATGT